MTDWAIFKGEGKPRALKRLPDPPPWRIFPGKATDVPPPPEVPPDDAYWERARTFKTPPVAKDVVNAALHLRRPILVTGSPGTGKSTLIYRVAYELGLGPVHVWPINSRTTLQDGLYRYDALDRLREARIARGDSSDGAPAAEDLDIGQFIQLGPLGTALLPSNRPRALLIDEVDKADVDLPNDLLNVFEDGRFEIPELSRRQAREAKARVRLFNPIPVNEAATTTITGGWVECREFPVVVLTSNRERDFPPAFLRRCLRVEMPPVSRNDLQQIVTNHLGPDVAAKAESLISDFLKLQDAGGAVATDQLLNAAYLFLGRDNLPDETVAALRALLLREIGLGA